ncbi:OTU domain-containing protein 1-like [Cyanistes caeruleus]|uniref:OTU domain-containing protein 1-like n=1 Tax=Cyanistes caeruleus TaxID=156563 RepID=UPI000CDB1532|nr:OTU domain-containing protein 1-like [Cyanistes caeruleus]XP_023781559.1 OTU domain-containing protein 1-like [Cyanistes caeruleus]
MASPSLPAGTRTAGALPGPAHPGQPAAATSGTSTRRKTRRKMKRRRRRTGIAARPAAPAPPSPVEPGARPGSGRRGREMGASARVSSGRVWPGQGRSEAELGRPQLRGPGLLGALQPRSAPLRGPLLRSTLTSEWKKFICRWGTFLTLKLRRTYCWLMLWKSSVSWIDKENLREPKRKVKVPCGREPLERYREGDAEKMYGSTPSKTENPSYMSWV